MLAFHFPPFAQSSGGIRTLSFVRHLPEYGWQPIVLTARATAYPEVDARSLAGVPSEAFVVRAPGLDVARHLSINGRYPAWLATPDRWNTWAACAVASGLASVRRHRPAVLWATFPIASAVVAALMLHKVTRIPLVIDLRDPMVYENWPEYAVARRVFSRIESAMVHAATAIIVTTAGARRLYVERYPQVPGARIKVIANGVDDAQRPVSAGVVPNATDPIVLLHSGLMEVPDRDPSAFFEAIASMHRAGDFVEGTLRVVLRATGREDDYRRQVATLNIGHTVAIEGRVPHAEAMTEMTRATGLLLFQGAQCNRQIPAKAYEYLVSQRPIIGLLDAHGDTQELIANGWGVPYVADMASAPAIAAMLRRFINDVRQRKVFVPNPMLIERHSRIHGAAELAAVFDQAGEATRA